MERSKLRQRITLKSASTSLDARGQETGSDTDIATRRASVRFLSGNELTAAQSLYPAATYEVVIRYESSLTIDERDHIVWGNLTLEIGSIENVMERNREWRFLCSVAK